MLTLLFFSFLGGVLTALSPCILPVLPAILASGVAKGKLRPLGTILGLTCSFSFFTLSLNWFLKITSLPPEILRNAAIGLIFFFGFVMVFPRLSTWFAKISAPIANLGQRMQTKAPKQGFFGGILFGLALGLLWTPCAGPILGTITALVATNSLTTTAVFMTLFYSLGAGIPLFLFAYGSGRIIEKSRFFSHHSERIRQLFGVVMVVFAGVLASNWNIVINEKIARFTPELFSEKSLTIPEELKALQGEELIVEANFAPELEGIAEWINSHPLSLKELKGKVVLLDFWSQSCINCLKAAPHLNTWHKKYKDQGLVVIGVHSSDSPFEKNPKNLRKALKSLGIEYPTALDNEYIAWEAYNVRYWPTFFLIDRDGVIQKVHTGAGDYEEIESTIQELLSR